jgi:hypothetical protein
MSFIERFRLKTKQERIAAKVMKLDTNLFPKKKDEDKSHELKLKYLEQEERGS